MTAVTGIGLQMQADPSSAQQLQASDLRGSVSATQHEHEFARAVQSTTPPEQVDAQPAATGSGMMSNMVQRLDSIAAGLRPDPVGGAESVHLHTLSAGDPASAPPPQDTKGTGGPESINETLDKALESYRRSVVFSVEAQVASTASTSTTKTFNSLMKGS